MSKIISLILLISVAITILFFAPTILFSVINNYALTTNALTSDTEYRGSGRKETKRTTQEEECPKGYRGSGRKGNRSCVLITKTTAYNLSASNFSTSNSRTNRPTRKVPTAPTGSTKKSTNSSKKTTANKKVKNPDCLQNHSIGGVYLFSDGSYEVTKSERWMVDTGATGGKRCVVEVQHCTKYNTREINNWAMPLIDREKC